MKGSILLISKATLEIELESLSFDPRPLLNK